VLPAELRFWRKSEMFSPLVWLSPAAKDFLSTTSQLLCGEVPCPTSKLADALRKADSSQCAGLLTEASLRMDVASKLEDGSVPEISDKCAAVLVDAFQSVLQKRYEEIKARAAPLAEKLSSGGLRPYKEVAAMLPDGTKVSKALGKDWLLWHAVGHQHSPDLLPQPVAGIISDRLATAACAGDGPLCDFALALHILNNLDEYVQWEISLPGSQPQASQKAVLRSFDAATAKEVALRRILSTALPPETATLVAPEVRESSFLAVLSTRAKSVRDSAVLPLYSAPQAAKEPKGKKDTPKEIPAQVPCTPGSFTALHQVTATQELQWQLLAYRLRPGTALGKASVSTLAAASTSASGSKDEGASRGISTPMTANAAPPPGFTGCWAPRGASMPPGHTQYSWHHVKAEGMAQGFPCTWSPKGTATPPGHTPVSWEKAISAITATSVAASASTKAASKPPASAQTVATAAKSKACAAAPAKPVASSGQEEGTSEAALAKIDLRCGRIIECSRVPDADTLYLLKINVGEEAPRQVISSLVKHYQEDQLKDRQVVVYCNIKPGKMRGYDSQAMILAATRDKGTENEVCELVTPPSGTTEGTRAMCGGVEVGSQSATQSVKHISKVWSQVQPLLQTSGSKEATFSGTTLTMNQAPLTVESLTGVGIY